MAICHIVHAICALVAFTLVHSCVLVSGQPHDSATAPAAQNGSNASNIKPSRKPIVLVAPGEDIIRIAVFTATFVALGVPTIFVCLRFMHAQRRRRKMLQQHTEERRRTRLMTLAESSSGGSFVGNSRANSVLNASAHLGQSNSLSVSGGKGGSASGAFSASERRGAGRVVFDYNYTPPQAPLDPAMRVDLDPIDADEWVLPLQLGDESPSGDLAASLRSGGLGAVLSPTQRKTGAAAIAAVARIAASVNAAANGGGAGASPNPSVTRAKSSLLLGAKGMSVRRPAGRSIVGGLTPFLTSGSSGRSASMDSPTNESFESTGAASLSGGRPVGAGGSPPLASLRTVQHSERESSEMLDTGSLTQQPA